MGVDNLSLEMFIWTLGGHHSISRGGVGWRFFEINNFGRTLREINNLLQELEINNLSATKTPAPLDIEWCPFTEN